MYPGGRLIVVLTVGALRRDTPQGQAGRDRKNDAAGESRCNRIPDARERDKLTVLNRVGEGLSAILVLFSVWKEFLRPRPAA